MKKVLSIIMAVILLLSMSVGSFAYTCDVFSSEAIDGFVEAPEEAPQKNTVQYSRLVTIDSKQYYGGTNYNIVAAEVNPGNCTIEEFFEEVGGSNAFAEQIIAECENQEYKLKGKGHSAEIATVSGYDAVLVKGSYDLTYTDGTQKTASLAMAVIPRELYAIYVTVMAIDGDDSYAILEKVLSTMTINVAEPSGAGNTEEVIINEDIETEPDEFIDAMAPVLIIAGTVWLVMLAVYIIVIILVIRSCKKIKKARQAYFASVAVNTPKGNSAPDENYKGDM